MDAATLKKLNADLRAAGVELETAAHQFAASPDGSALRELRAAGVGLALSLLRMSVESDPARNFRPAIVILETFIAGCKS